MLTSASPRRRRSRLGWLAAPAVAILLAGACGDDDDTLADDTTTTSPADDTTTTTDGVTTDDPDVTDDLTTAGEEAQRDIERALRDAGLDSLASAVAMVDLSGILQDNEFTLFAPNDDAFLALDSDTLGDLLADPAQIVALLENHVVVGERITVDGLADLTTVETEAGNSLSITEVAGSTTVDGAEVLNSEDVGDGIIHIIDQVLLPGTAT